MKRILYVNKEIGESGKRIDEIMENIPGSLFIGLTEEFPLIEVKSSENEIMIQPARKGYENVAKFFLDSIMQTEYAVYHRDACIKPGVDSWLVRYNDNILRIHLKYNSNF